MAKGYRGGSFGGGKRRHKLTDVQAAGSSDDQQPFYAGQLDCLDDARIDAQRLFVNVGIVPARVVGADYRVVVADGFPQGRRVGCVGRPRFEI